MRYQSLLEQGLAKARSDCVDGDGASPLAGLLDKYALSPSPRDVRYVLSVLRNEVTLGPLASPSIQLDPSASALRHSRSWRRFEQKSDFFSCFSRFGRFALV